MTARTVTDPHFDGLTIRDQRGSSLVVERTHDNGRTVVWIAPPGTNDGPGVGLDDADRAALVGFLSTGGADQQPTVWGIPAEPGEGMPHVWHELLGEHGPLTEATTVGAVNG